MRIASIAEAKARLSQLVREVEQEPVLITRHGKPRAMLVPVPADTDALERLLLVFSPRFQGIVAQALRELQAGYGIPHEAFWAQVEADAVDDERDDAEA